jgi:enoyl-CoA hydratase/carnithine racemase
MPKAGLVEVSQPAEGVVRLVLNRPEKKNALSVGLRDAVSDALDDLAEDEGVRVVIVAGAGDTFCAGFDLREFEIDTPGFQKRLWQSSDRFHRRVMRFPVPTIAAVQGPALAGGFDLAVLCDIRMADTRARFGHPEQSWSDVVFTPLADLVGSARARDLCFTGRSIDATTAWAYGLVSAVVEPDELAGQAVRTAQMIARAPRPSLMRTKAKALRHAGIAADETTLEL